MKTTSPLKKAVDVMRKGAPRFSTNSGEAPFDWHSALQKAQQGGPTNHLSRLACSWVTCACGNQCAIIPRDDDGAPVDTKLERLGVYFHRAITSERWDDAEKLLKQIERRSATLIEQELKKLQSLGLSITLNSAP